MKKFACLLPLVLALAACSAPDSSAPPSAQPPAAPAPEATDQPAAPPPPQSADDLAAAKLGEVLAGSWRSDKNKARDVYRHPQQTLAFFGVKPGRH